MSPEFLDDCTRLVNSLEDAQRDLLQTLQLKRRALVAADAAELQRLGGHAAAAIHRCQELSAWRSRLIRSVSATGRSTLSEILATSVTPRAETLRGRLVIIQQRFAELRREAWIQWIVAQRSGGYLTEVLDLIAGQGRAAIVYGEVARPGAAVLDAAA
jgi:hypothetical protein